MPNDFKKSLLFPSTHGLLSRQISRMVDSSRRGRVGLGLIGLGPGWEQVYRDSLIRLQNRLTVRVVYDSVEGRARSIANDLGVPVANSLKQMLHDSTLQGLLVLDPGWCSTGVLSLIASANVPVFLGCPVLKNVFDWSFLLKKRTPSATEHSATRPFDNLLMPELGHRFTPASCRLRELIVTKLGLPQKIEIECNLQHELSQFAALVDWCSNLLGDDPVSVLAIGNSPSESLSYVLEFPSLSPAANSSSEGNRRAIFRQGSDEDSTLKIDVECERGHAALIHRTKIAWKTNSDSAEESLTDERTETEILIDQFCRRALGGLNPVGQLSELIKATEIVQSIRNGKVNSKP